MRKLTARSLFRSHPPRCWLPFTGQPQPCPPFSFPTLLHITILPMVHLPLLTPRGVHPSLLPTITSPAQLSSDWLPLSPVPDDLLLHFLANPYTCRLLSPSMRCPAISHNSIPHDCSQNRACPPLVFAAPAHTITQHLPRSCPPSATSSPPPDHRRPTGFHHCSFSPSSHLWVTLGPA